MKKIIARLVILFVLTAPLLLGCETDKLKQENAELKKQLEVITTEKTSLTAKINEVTVQIDGLAKSNNEFKIRNEELAKSNEEMLAKLSKKGKK